MQSIVRERHLPAVTVPIPLGCGNDQEGVAQCDGDGLKTNRRHLRFSGRHRFVPLPGARAAFGAKGAIQ